MRGNLDACRARGSKADDPRLTEIHDERETTMSTKAKYPTPNLDGYVQCCDCNENMDRIKEAVQADIARAVKSAKDGMVFVAGAMLGLDGSEKRVTVPMNIRDTIERALKEYNGQEGSPREEKCSKAYKWLDSIPEGSDDDNDTR